MGSLLATYTVIIILLGTLTNTIYGVHRSLMYFVATTYGYLPYLYEYK